MLYPFSTLDSFTEASSLQPLIDVRDRGATPLSEVCQLIMVLFRFQDTVTATVVVNQGRYDADTFDQILQNILSLDVEITDSDQLNSTYLQVDFFARNSAGMFVEPGSIVLTLQNLNEDQRQPLVDAGLSIIQVVSNGEVPTPTPSSTATPVPTRPFPTWAVVLIVVLNSVIIIAVLLLILGIVCKRYSR